jgi:hypothetical protein
MMSRRMIYDVTPLHLVITFTMYATMSFVVKNVVAPKLTSGSGHMVSHEHGR